MKRNSLAHAATLLPLAIGLAMNGVSSRGHAFSFNSDQPAACSQLGIDSNASESLGHATSVPSRACKTRLSNGFLLPDSECTPGAVNPTVTTEVLRGPSFRTACVRGHASSAAEKNQTYQRYAIEHPDQNTGQTQACELDHLISLELGGADTVDNIWPQCGPPGVSLSERYFKRKDAVENFLAKQVREGKMSLAEAQKGIATDWTQFLAVSEGCEGAACE
jgi:5-methylcytosine-specific restriction endonuclease McrA